MVVVAKVVQGTYHWTDAVTAGYRDTAREVCHKVAEFSAPAALEAGLLIAYLTIRSSRSTTAR
jgi:hypothetical protein